MALWRRWGQVTPTMRLAERLASKPVLKVGLLRMTEGGLPSWDGVSNRTNLSLLTAGSHRIEQERRQHTRAILPGRAVEERRLVGRVGDEPDGGDDVGARRRLPSIPPPPAYTPSAFPTLVALPRT
jgi:hypothetical protein